MFDLHALRRHRRTRSMLLLALLSWLLLGFSVAARPVMGMDMHSGMSMGDPVAACCPHGAADGMGMAHCHCASTCANVLPPVAMIVHAPVRWQTVWPSPPTRAPEMSPRPPLRPPQA